MLSKKQRRGVLWLVLLVVCLQVIIYYVTSQESVPLISENTDLQEIVDSLKVVQTTAHKKYPKQYPFNPNYITDYKGYILGMSTKQIDRLHDYRAKEKYVNSPAEFQKVTGISDELLDSISPYFKFPDWVVSKTKKAQKTNRSVKKIPLNTATALQLRKVNGIGSKLSDRIIKFRKLIGGFVTEGQLYEVYGLKPEVISRILERFSLVHPVGIDKINVNMASAKELASVYSLSYPKALKIVAYRTKVIHIERIEALKEVVNLDSIQMAHLLFYLKI